MVARHDEPVTEVAGARVVATHAARPIIIDSGPARDDAGRGRWVTSAGSTD